MTDFALIERITRSLAFMLRHQPETFDLELDPYGYADLTDVVHALNERLGEPVEEDDVREAVRSGDRPRYEVVDGRIRALYGHSIPVEPGPSSKPPELLYVAVPERELERARRFGLRGGRRRFLHLALTPEDASESGRRAARDYAVLTVRALDAWEEGISFYDRVALWLAEEVPTHLLDLHGTFHDGTEPEGRPHDGPRERHSGGHGGHGGHGGGRERGRGRRGGQDRPRGHDGWREERRDEPAERSQEPAPNFEARDERGGRGERRPAGHGAGHGGQGRHEGRGGRRHGGEERPFPRDPEADPRREPRGDERAPFPRDEGNEEHRPEAREARAGFHDEGRRDERHEGRRDERPEGRREERQDGRRDERHEGRRDERHGGRHDERRGDRRDERPAPRRDDGEPRRERRDERPPERREERRDERRPARTEAPLGGFGAGLDGSEAHEPRRAAPPPPPAREPAPERRPAPAPADDSGPSFGAGL